MYRHLQSSKGLELDKYLDELHNSRGIARRQKIARLDAEAAQLDRHFGFASGGVKTMSNGDYEFVRSREYPAVTMVRYRIDGEEPHRIVFIKRDKGVEYYNPNGTPYSALPRNFKSILYHDLNFSRHITPMTTITPTTSALVNHQGVFPVCAMCATVRSTLSHEDNAQFNMGLLAGADGKPPVQRLVGAGLQTNNLGVRPAEKPQSTQSLKKGGIVKGKKGAPVRVIAHAGELVVPTEAVPNVQAWFRQKKLVSILESTKPTKKLMAKFIVGGRSVTTHFGSAGMDDYTITHNVEQRKRYRARHAKDLLSNDPTKAGILSYHILWGDSTSRKANIAVYKKRYFTSMK